MSEDMAVALRSIADGLEIVTDGFRALAGAVADVSLVKVCGYRPYGRKAIYSCVRPESHVGDHADCDGDEF